MNATIRAIGKTAIGEYGMQVVGFRDGFRGLMENRTIRLGEAALSGILTLGGTILGTSRDKPHPMPMGSQELDMTEVMVQNYNAHHLDALVCLGGGVLLPGVSAHYASAHSRLAIYALALWYVCPISLALGLMFENPPAVVALFYDRPRFA